MKGFHTANQLIDEALVNIRDFERINYKEAAVYFLAGYREFQLFEAGAQVKEARVNISPINTVSFPEDLLRLIDVNVVIDGEYFSFTRSDKLIGVSDPLDASLNSDRGEDDTINRTPSTGYGTKGSNLEYYYREDRTKRRVILSRMALDKALFADRTEVLIRYVSYNMDDFNSTYIADDAANLLIAYVVSKLVSARPDKYNGGYMAMKKGEYVEQLRMYRALEMPSLQDLEDMIYETSSQNVRRG
jgi:hypothetical protein